LLRHVCGCVSRSRSIPSISSASVRINKCYGSGGFQRSCPLSSPSAPRATVFRVAPFGRSPTTLASHMWWRTPGRRRRCAARRTRCSTPSPTAPVGCRCCPPPLPRRACGAVPAPTHDFGFGGLWPVSRHSLGRTGRFDPSGAVGYRNCHGATGTMTSQLLAPFLADVVIRRDEKRDSEK
jgi:hypothetical protein